ncbi:MAG: hypothetical protein MHPSP_004432, partial [Paramarteilia canceri]
SQCFAYSELNITAQEAQDPQIVRKAFNSAIKQIVLEGKSKEQILKAKEVLESESKHAYCIIDNSFNRNNYDQWISNGGFISLQRNSDKKVKPVIVKVPIPKVILKK